MGRLGETVTSGALWDSLREFPQTRMTFRPLWIFRGGERRGGLSGLPACLPGKSDWDGVGRAARKEGATGSQKKIVNPCLSLIIFFPLYFTLIWTEYLD